MGVHVHEGTGRLIFTDIEQHPVIKSDLHSPSKVSVITGESGQPGMNDGRRECFPEPSKICVWETLLFVCDSSNGCICVVDEEMFVSKRTSNQHAADVSTESEESVQQVEADSAT